MGRSRVAAILGVMLVATFGGLAEGQVTQTSTELDSATTASGPFRQGQADRQAWESWIAGQTGDRLAGATFWAAHRSLASPPECAQSGGSNQAWMDGCNAARDKLANSDELRRSSPEYRLGWNSVAVSPSAATAPAANLTDGNSVQAAPPTDIGELPVAAPPTEPSPTAPLPAASSSSAGPFWFSIFGIALLSLVGLLFWLSRGKPSAGEQLKTLLVPGEAVIASAMQHRIYALLSRRNLAAVTTGRFILLQRHLLGGFVMFDMRWQDIKEAKLSVGMLSASVGLAYSANLSDTAMNEGNTQAILASGLVIPAAQAIYRECQAQEQSWREKRRVRSIEEMRAKAGGVQIATGIYPPGFQGVADIAQTLPASDTLTNKLTQARDLKAQGLITDAEYEAIKARVVQSL